MVDDFRFPYDDWSNAVPRVVAMMEASLQDLAVGTWWKSVVDVTQSVKVKVCSETSDLTLMGVDAMWQDYEDVPMDIFDTFTAIFEMAFHGMGGGAARMKELEDQPMHCCLFHNNSVYFTLASIKVFNIQSKKMRHVERKLPPIVARYYLLFRSLVQSWSILFEEDPSSFLIPSRINRSKSLGPSYVIKDLFGLESTPDMTQVRQFWASVSNCITGKKKAPTTDLTSSDQAAEKLGHSSSTHAARYSSEEIGSEEQLYNKYHFGIGDTSHRILQDQEFLSKRILQETLTVRFPSLANNNNGPVEYLSKGQQEVVEYLHGAPTTGNLQHCLGLLAAGDGKSEMYLLPTLARAYCHHRSKTIVYVGPYGFLTGYQAANALSAFEKSGYKDRISVLVFTGSDIKDGVLPIELSDKNDLPSLLFLNLDAMSNLFKYFREQLKSWVDRLEMIVVDEIHTIYSEMDFRNKYSVYSRLSSLGVPIVGLSGSVPLFAVSRLAKRLCLSVQDDLSDLKIVHGGDVVGTFPKGFKIQVSITDNCIEEVALFVHKRLGQGTATTETATATTTGVTEAIHVFVSRKNDGTALERLFAVQYPNNCRFVSADNSKDEINQVAAEWGRSVFSILISTSIALVGNENPKCRHLACAGYLFDVMSMVQFFGRLRPYMRSPTGQVFLCVPNKLPARRQVDDESRWTTLLNEQLMGVEDHSQYVASMTSKGLQDWLIDAANGTSGCSLKKLSGIMGKKRHDNCGVCKSCRSSPLVVVQVEAQNRLATITSNGTACERVLNRLNVVWLVVRKTVPG